MFAPDRIRRAGTGLVLLLAASTALAVDIDTAEARADQNLLGGQVQVKALSAGPASVDLGAAQAVAGLDGLWLRVEGGGASTSTRPAAAGAAAARYTLWDLAGDRALDEAEAQGLQIAFDFALVAAIDVPQGLTTTGGLGFDLLLSGSGIASRLTGSYVVSWAAGSAQPLIDADLVASGSLPALVDGSWLQGASGNGALAITLRQGDAATGVLTTSANTVATRDAGVALELSLLGARLVAGHHDGLALRFDEPGSMLPLSPVPEPESAWLLALGLAVLRWRRRG